MARNDAMRDSFFAPVLLRIETVLHETDCQAKAQGLAFTDSAARSLLVRASNEARGKPAKTSAASPKDQLLAAALVKLAGQRADLLVVEDGEVDRADETTPLSVADWLRALEAVKQSCELRTTDEPGSRGYLDFLAGFLRDTAKPVRPEKA